MHEVSFPLADPAATARAGQALAVLLDPGDAIALIGDLGAGKTTFVDACVRALGGEGAHSPTFALVHEYPCQRGGRPLTVWHVDLYRVERPTELVELGLEDLLGNRAGVAFLEWADQHDVMPRSHLRLVLAHRPDSRLLTISGAGGAGGRGAALAAAFADSLTAALAVV
jgi:tRNA threonylcarbamoyl adenosine modification protein YjeE